MSRDHAACVGSYCDAILSGEIIAGRYVQLAVRRYLDDIEHAHERGLYLLQFERLNWRRCLSRRLLLPLKMAF